jgi:hypothetical protein
LNGNKPATAAGLDDQHHGGREVVTVRSRPASPIATQGLPVEREQAGDAAGLDDQHHGPDLVTSTTAAGKW